MTEQPMPRDPHEGIKADADPETLAADRDQSSYVARGGQSSGIVSTGPAPGPEQPGQSRAGGTADGDVVSGVSADTDDVADAVKPDSGPPAGRSPR